MLTVSESSHSPFWNNASEADHWETEIRCYNSLGSFLESNPGTLVERVCQHPPAKQSDGFVKLPHSLISFAFYCHPRIEGSDALPRVYIQLYESWFLLQGKLDLRLPWTAPYLRLWKSWKHATVFTSSSMCMKKTSVMVCQRKPLGSKPSC